MAINVLYWREICRWLPRLELPYVIKCNTKLPFFSSNYMVKILSTSSFSSWFLDKVETSFVTLIVSRLKYCSLTWLSLRELHWLLRLCLTSLPIGIVTFSIFDALVFLQSPCTAVTGECGARSSCFCRISSTMRSPMEVFETVHSSVYKRQTLDKNRKSFLH